MIVAAAVWGGAEHEGAYEHRQLVWLHTGAIRGSDPAKPRFRQFAPARSFVRRSHGRSSTSHARKPPPEIGQCLALPPPYALPYPFRKDSLRPPNETRRLDPARRSGSLRLSRDSLVPNGAMDTPFD